MIKGEFGDSKLRLEEVSMQSPLIVFNSIRSRILGDVIQKTSRSDRPNLFTKTRIQNDRKLWNQVHHQLLQSASESNREEMMNRVLGHYANEIGGHFSQDIYQFATKAVPVGFNFLLNAASVNTLLPWKWTEDVQGRMNLTGEIEHLRKLSKQGTVLIVPTHQSNIDSILIGYVIYLLGLPPHAYGAGLNLFSNPLLKFFMGNLGAYTVDRQKNNKL
ncbi:MAG: hypothetical protein EOP09_20915, partial [Proteobacteria bacterium]